MKSIDRETWLVIDRLLDGALECGVPERSAYLDRECSNDPFVRGHVDALLAADASAGAFLEQAVDRVAGPLLAAAAADDALAPGAVIGAWRILRPIASGGMGTVHLAERADGAYPQQAALKLLRAGWHAASVRERFLRERRILAGLEHPGIARLLDGGWTEDGRPWFAMEYVDGEPIVAFADRHRLDLDARLELLLGVCDAAAYAQRRLVVHRDLKPSNILVTSDRTVKLLDFGIAKLFGEDEGEGITIEGTRFLTPEYGAPEQIRGEPVTTATDVWALGCVLHELLAGAHPFPGRRGTGDLQRAILEQPARRLAPAIPSDAGSAARARRTTPRKLRARLSGDLSNIASRALEKEPEQRYATVQDLRDDLARHRDGRPVEARAPSVAYLVAKFARRNRLALGAAIAVILSLITGLVVAMGQARRADEKARVAASVSEFLVALFEAADPAESEGRDVSVAEIVQRGTERVETELAAEPEVQAQLLRTLGRIQGALGNYAVSARLHKQALETRQARFGEEHDLVLESLTDLGGALHLLSENAAADSLLERAVRLARRPPVDAGRLAAAVENLAAVKSALGDRDEAEPLYREAIELDRGRFGPRHVEVATDLNNLGVFLAQRGMAREAVATHREALAMRRELLGADHPDVAVSLSNLGDALADAGDLEEAERFLEEAVSLRGRVYGGSHPRLATSLRNLADLRMLRDDLVGADSLLQQSLAMSRKHLGDVHLDVAGCVNALAVNAFYRGDLQTAAARFAESLGIFEQLLPAGHPTILTLTNNLATVALESGDIERAEGAFGRLLTMRREELGERHPDVAQAWIAVGNVHVRRGRWGPAVAACSTAVAIDEELHGPDHLDVADARGYLGRALALAGRQPEGVHQLRAASERYRREFPQGHRRLAGLEVELARALAREGPSEEALQLATEAEAWFRQNHGAADPRTADAMAARGECLVALGRTAEARVVLSEALSSLLETRGPRHPGAEQAAAALARLPR